MNLAPLAVSQFFDNNGKPMNGGLLFTYIAGTTTKLATYTDSTGLSSNTNPIVLDFRGEARIWLDPTLTYKFTLAPAGDTDPPTKPIWTVDQITSALSYAILTQQFIGQILFPRTAAEIAAGVTPTNYAVPSHLAIGSVYVQRYGAVGDGSNDDTSAINNAIAVAFKGGVNAGSVQLIPGGTHKTTSNITWQSGVSIIGDPVKYTSIKPSSAVTICLDANITLYNQAIRGVVIDGANLTGTARALRIVNGNRTKFDQFSVQNCTGTTVATTLINGAGYQLGFWQCVWSNNFKHIEVTKNGVAADFPTALLFDYCIMEAARSVAGAAIAVTDCSGVTFRECTVQANETLYTLFVQRTAAQVTGDDPQVIGGWWEDNGNSQAGSIAMYFSGSVSGRVKNPLVKDVKFHQGLVNKPHYQIWAEYTDGLKVSNCSENFGAGAEFVHDGGNNLNFYIDWRGTTSTVQLKTPQDWASTNFNGKAGISVNSSWNVTPTRNSAGNYTLTFASAAPAANYIVNANAEDASVSIYLIASPGPASSTASFTLFVSDAAGVATDGRTIAVSVKAIPA